MSRSGHVSDDVTLSDSDVGDAKHGSDDGSIVGRLPRVASGVSLRSGGHDDHSGDFPGAHLRRPVSASFHRRTTSNIPRCMMLPSWAVGSAPAPEQSLARYIKTLIGADDAHACRKLRAFMYAAVRQPAVQSLAREYVQLAAAVVSCQPTLLREFQRRGVVQAAGDDTAADAPSSLLPNPLLTLRERLALDAMFERTDSKQWATQELQDVLDAEDRKRSRRRSSAGNQQFTSHGHGLAHRCALPYVVGSSLFPCVRRDEVPCGCVDAGSGPWRTRSAIVSGTLCSTY